jgi:hypothetical protein
VASALSNILLEVWQGICPIPPCGKEVIIFCFYF